MNNTPKIWLGCLAAYNAGNLHGEWIDLPRDADEMQAAQDKIIKSSPAVDSEELFVADYDNCANLGEYPNYDDLFELAAAYDACDDPEIIDGLISLGLNISELAGAVDDVSIYKDWDSLVEDHAEVYYGEFINSRAGVYFDYEAFERDLNIELTHFETKSGAVGVLHA